MSLGVGSLVIGQEPDSSYIKAGESAYQIAVRKGFIGTESEWLQSLQGGGRAYSGAVPPGAPTIGDLWWDTVNKRLYVYQTSNWAEVNGNNDEFPAVDLDANAYIAAVEAADTAAGFTGGLEQAVKDALTMFVVNAKLDGIWSAIKASCIMAGARSLNGALVPLKGTAPTNINFMQADYDRKTGLIGDASSKYIETGYRHREVADNPLQHIYVNVSQADTGNRSYVGGGYGPLTYINSSSTQATFRNHENSILAAISYTSPLVGGLGMNRISSSQYERMLKGVISTATANYAGNTSDNTTFQIFGRMTPAASPIYSNARLSFYSIGESINFAKLNSRISTLMSQLNTAIV